MEEAAAQVAVLQQGQAVVELQDRAVAGQLQDQVQVVPQDPIPAAALRDSRLQHLQTVPPNLRQDLLQVLPDLSTVAHKELRIDKEIPIKQPVTVPSILHGNQEIRQQELQDKEVHPATEQVAGSQTGQEVQLAIGQAVIAVEIQV